MTMVMALVSHAGPSQIHVAAIQMHTRAFKESCNLAQAEAYVIEAKNRGAKLVVLPEFFHCGYTFEKKGRDACQPIDGMAGSFLRRLARENRIWVAGTIYEKGDTGCFNSFLLVGPKHQEYKHRKATTPALESYFFEATEDPFVVETEIGRIGLVICAESMEGRFLNKMIEGRPNLILMAFSAPGSLKKAGDLLGPSPKDVIYHVSQTWAKTVGVPVVTASVVGRWRSGVPHLHWPKLKTHFWGHSGIFRADGSIAAGLKDDEGIVDAVIEITLNSSQTATMIDNDVVPLPKIYKRLLKPNKAGARSYRRWIGSWRMLASSTKT